MKVLVIGVDLPPPMGGLAKRMLNHATIWIREGCDVHIILPFKKKVKIPKSLENLHINFLIDERKAPKIILSSIISLIYLMVKAPLTTLRVLGIISYLTYKGSFSKFWALFAFTWITKVFQYCKKNFIQIINVHYAFEQCILSTIVAHLAKIPVVLTSYSEMLYWEEEGIDYVKKYSPLFSLAVNSVNGIISLSNHCLKGVLRFLRKNIPYEIVYSGVTPQGSFSLTGERDQIVLFVGQLHWRKGPDLLLEAFAKVVKEFPSSKLYYVGPDQGMGRLLEKRVKELNLEQNVYFLGEVEETKLWKLYGTASLLVYPSITQRECMGMSIKEAMLSGMPVIGFSTGGVSEAIRNGETGYLVPIADVDELAEAIKRILRDEALRKRFGETAKEVASSLFLVDVTAKKEVEFFKKILKTSRAETINRYTHQLK